MKLLAGGSGLLASVGLIGYFFSSTFLSIYFYTMGAGLGSGFFELPKRFPNPNLDLTLLAFILAQSCSSSYRCFMQ